MQPVVRTVRTDLLISIPVQHGEVLSQPVVQLVATTAVSSADVARTRHAVPPALRALPHSPGGHVTSEHLPQAAAWRGVVEVIDETDELLAGLRGVVPPPLPLQVLLQARPEHLTRCELIRWKKTEHTRETDHTL